MEQELTPDKDTIPYDDGFSAGRARARTAIARALEISPRRALGENLIKDLAAALERQRKKDRKVITPFRLAYALRHVVEVAVSYVNGSTVRSDTAILFLGPLADSPSKLRADAETAKLARKKLASARRLIKQTEKVLNSDEIAAFSSPNAETFRSIRSEMDRLEASLLVPPGLLRGRPALRQLVAFLHQVLFQLTGSWLRSWGGDGTDQDRFLSDTMHRICKPMIGDAFSDNDLGQTIETVIKSGKNSK